MKPYYYLIIAMLMSTIIVAQNPGYNIEDIELNGQSFKRITGTINVDETLDNSSFWIIADTVRVAQSAKLTITQGTQIFAENNETLLYVNDDGEIDWQGTSTEPVVFNSLANAPNQGDGDNTSGQWDGVRIDGGGIGSNSGIMRYVRVMYSGQNSNGLELRNVGSGTTVEYVQVYKNDGTAGIRINSGDVNLKYIIATNSSGRGLRFDDDGGELGWSGAGQFIVVNKDIEAADAIESRDNTSPILSNVTVTGIGLNSPGSTILGDGPRVRDDGDLKLYNTVLTGVQSSLRMDNANGIASGNSVFANSASFDNADDDGTGFHSSTSVFNPTSDSYDPAFNNSVTPFTIVDSYVGTSTENSTPAGALNPFFDDVNYVGAVQAGEGNDWTVGWTLNLDGTLREDTFSVNEFEKLDISIYPNPVQNNLFIDTKLDIGSVLIYNTTGRLIYENNSFNNESNNPIDMSEFQTGIYFIKVSSGDDSKTLKVIKQ